jgi:hypothetical protein
VKGRTFMLPCWTFDNTVKPRRGEIAEPRVQTLGFGKHKVLEPQRGDIGLTLSKLLCGEFLCHPFGVYGRRAIDSRGLHPRLFYPTPAGFAFTQSREII